MRIGGRVHGSLTVINGDLIDPARAAWSTATCWWPAADARSSRAGLHDGEQRVFWDAAPVPRQSDGLLVMRERRRPFGELATAQKSFQTGNIRTTIRLTTTQTYNRIEGLGIVFGPAFEWRASDALTASLDLRGILRTAPDPSPFRRDLGWLIRTDWRFHGVAAASASGPGPTRSSPASRSTPCPAMRSAGTPSSSSVTTGDYFSSEGVAGSAYTISPGGSGWTPASATRSRARCAANDPWSLFRNDERWRPNPLIDDGHYTVLGLSTEYDSRNAPEPRRPPDGGCGRASSTPAATMWRRSALPATVRTRCPPRTMASAASRSMPAATTGFPPMPSSTSGSGPAGWLAGDPLPMQRRLSLGGLDLLPGYGFRASELRAAGLRRPRPGRRSATGH